MSTIKWATPAAISTVLDTGLNSLANGSYSAAASAYDNETNLYEFASYELNLGSLTPASGGYCQLYLVYSLDGTNFEDGGGATAPPANALVATFDLRAATAAQRRVVENIQLSPFQFKEILYNGAGVALAASGNTVKRRLHNEQVV